MAGPSKGPDRHRQEETPHPITPSPLFPLPGEREEGEGSWGEGSRRNHENPSNANSRNGQTSAASPAEPGAGLWPLTRQKPLERISLQKSRTFDI